MESGGMVKIIGVGWCEEGGWKMLERFVWVGIVENVGVGCNG